MDSDSLGTFSEDVVSSWILTDTVSESSVKGSEVSDAVVVSSKIGEGVVLVRSSSKTEEIVDSGTFENSVDVTTLIPSVEDDTGDLEEDSGVVLDSDNTFDVVDKSGDIDVDFVGSSEAVVVSGVGVDEIVCLEDASGIFSVLDPVRSSGSEDSVGTSGEEDATCVTEDVTNSGADVGFSEFSEDISERSSVETVLDWDKLLVVVERISGDKVVGASVVDGSSEFRDTSEDVFGVSTVLDSDRLLGVVDDCETSGDKEDDNTCGSEVVNTSEFEFMGVKD